MKPKTLGRHLLVEFYNCSAEFLNDVWGIETAMNQAARACKATIVQSCFHRFMPHGVSGVVVIAESHLSFHSFTRKDYFFFDLFSCKPFDVNATLEFIRDAFDVGEMEIHYVERGRDFPREERVVPFVSDTPATAERSRPRVKVAQA